MQTAVTLRVCESSGSH